MLEELFGITIRESDVEKCILGIPNPENSKRTPASICQKVGCYFIYENKKSLMKFTKNKKKMKFINTAIFRGVDLESILEVINSNFTELESLLLYTLDDLKVYKKALMNSDDCDIESMLNMADENPDIIEPNEEVDLAEVIFESGLSVEGDFSKMMNEIAMISILKTKRLMREEHNEKSLAKAEKYLRMGTKAIEVKQKIEELEANNKPSEKTEEFLVEFDRCGLSRPKFRKEILD